MAGVLIMLYLIACGAARAQRIAITFDDLPAHSVLPRGETRMQVAKQILRALRRAHLPPTYGFVNAEPIEKTPDLVTVLAAWRTDGNLLGNHTWSHMNLNQNTLAAFEQDLTKDEPALKLQMNGQDWHWFRFPYLAEGDTNEKKMGIRVFLAQHGYKIAGVTMSFADYSWNEPYARCADKGDRVAIARLERSYLKAADENIRYYRGMSKTLYGKDIPYVLLMHIGAFDARMLPRLLRLYRHRGFKFISLQDAEKDPFYKYDVDPKLLPGPDTLQAALAEQHKAVPPAVQPRVDLDSICK
jgi:peptidoglycan/xylan/chitin deacetylase (PgdA/CDA1 family)